METPKLLQHKGFGYPVPYDFILNIPLSSVIGSILPRNYLTSSIVKR